MRFVAAAFVSFLAAFPALALEPGDAMPALAGARMDVPRASAALEELRGTVVYVDFWASWCVPCRVSMPALDALYRKHAARGFVVVGVNKDVEEAAAKRFLARVPVTFPLVHDAGDDIARAFGVKAMPSGYLVDRAGKVRRVHRGFNADTAAALDSEIEQLLGAAR